jgi:lipopolysaccharide export system permease protein
MPIFLLSLLLCGISAWVNLEVAPRCRIAYKNLLFKLGAELSNVRLPEGRYISDFPGCTIYIGKKHEKEKLENVILILDLTNSTITAQAPRGQYRLDTDARQIVLELFDVHGVQMSSDGGTPVSFAELPIYLPLPLSERKQPRISDMTLIELQRELRRIERQLRTVRSPPNASTNTLADLHRTRGTQVKDITTPIRVQIHRSVATSFACFGFTLVGIPLAIRLHRRETNVGFGVALALVLIYYGFISVAQSLDTRPELVPHLILWLPNIIFQAVGIVLLWRANRGV